MKNETTFSVSSISSLLTSSDPLNFRNSTDKDNLLFTSTRSGLYAPFIRFSSCIASIFTFML